MLSLIKFLSIHKPFFSQIFSQRMRPTNYKLFFEPDLDNFDFLGKTVITIESEIEEDQVVLNAKELTINKCLYNNQECTFSFSPQDEEVTIVLPEKVKGVFELTIEYSGKINNDMLGFYRSRYTVDGKTKYMAVTQFEERYARKAFPCFDHPSKKATFDIEFLIDANLGAIANTPIKKEEKRDNNKKLVVFEQTPKMSTYLIFLGVGEFEFITDKDKYPSEHTVVRVATPPGMTKYGEFALDMGRKSLKWGEEFTGIDFPIGKCDYIAVKDFAFGAMENFGAITFRENLLLVYPGLTSKASLASIASVIAHETAHMWFGDIVSPADWKYVWLNESFASFFTYAIPDAYFPEWKLWDSYLLYVKRGFDRDSLKNTIPIELPGEDTEIKIDSSSAPIIYNKGSAIIRMLEDFLGLEKFKKGINYFLQNHKFEAATTENYWNDFEEATKEPIKDFANTWIHQPGYPLIEVTGFNNDKLTIKQSRFYFGNKESDEKWIVPLTIKAFLKNGGEQVVKAVMKEKSLTIDMPADTVAIKINAGQKGYYRVKYTAELLKEVGKLVKEKKIDSHDRYGLLDDMYSLMKRGDYSISYYLNFIEEYYSEENDYLPLTLLASSLEMVYDLNENYKAEAEKIGLNIFGKVIEKIGLDPSDDDTMQTTQLRSTLMWMLALMGSQKVRDFALKQFNNYIKGETVHADILSVVLRIGTFLDTTSKDILLSKLNDSSVPEEEKLKLLGAITNFRESKILKEIIDYSLENVPKRNLSNVISSIGRNKEARSWMWDWFTENYDKLAKTIPKMHLGGLMLSITAASGIGREKEVNEFFNELLAKDQSEKASIEMGLELLEIYSKLSNQK